MECFARNSKEDEINIPSQRNQATDRVHNLTGNIDFMQDKIKTL